MKHEQLQAEIIGCFEGVKHIPNPHIDEDYELDQVPVFNYMKDAKQSLLLDRFIEDRNDEH